MDQIRKKIEDVLGEYNEEVDKVISGQILRIIKTTGKFIADDYVLQVVQPDIKAERSMIMDGHDYVFSIKGAVRLVPKKSFIPTIIKDEILQGGMIKEFKRSNDFNGYRFQIEGIKQVPWEDHSRPRFSFSLVIRTVEPRIVEWLEGRLGDK